MPSFPLVPMLFTALGGRDPRRSSHGRPTPSTDPPLENEERDEGPNDDALEKHRRADLDNVSSTEEDADESLEDWWQLQRQQQTPTTTTVSTPVLSPNCGLASSSTLPRPYPIEAPTCDLVRRTGDDVESVDSRVSLERMKVIPFVSLHLEPKPSRSTKQEASSSSPSKDDDDGDGGDDEHSYHWNLLISRALDGDRRSNASLDHHKGESPRRAAASKEGGSGTSPSSCSPGRMRTVPLRSVIRATGRTETQRRSLDSRGRRRLGPTLPTLISVHCTAPRDACFGEETLLWDPARPLLFGDPTKDSIEWKSHALDGQSKFSELCHEALSHLTSNRRDDRLLSMVQRTPELCLVRFRVDNSVHHLLHWCCRHLWLDGVRQCYRAVPEMIGFALETMLPLHIAVIAAGRTLAVNESDEELIEFLCKQYPAALRHTNEKLQTPLHLALSSSLLNEAAIKCFLEVYPTAALLADESGWTPVHYLCQNRWSDEHAARVLRLVLQHSPSSADAVTRHLEKPIHVAARTNAASLIRVFLESDNGVVTDRCDSESTLSSFGSSGNETLEDETLCDRQLYRSSPSAASLILCLDAEGNSPVHILATHGREVDPGLMATIADMHPEVTALKNDSGLTPFDLALAGGANQEVLRILQDGNEFAKLEHACDRSILC